jgi:ADP-ribose pyrophosphatase YjhB (NUDIX family)
MNSVSKILATGVDVDGNIVTWVVGVYADPQEAYKHHALCHAYLARAKAGLPAELSYREREDAMRKLQPSHDPQYATMQAFEVTYNLDAYPLMSSAPVADEVTWRALDGTSAALNHLVDGVARRFMRDEELEGAPADPLPSKAIASRQLWLIGIDPSLPAVNAAAGETGADAFYRMFGEAVAQRRRDLHDRCMLKAA